MAAAGFMATAGASVADQKKAAMAAMAAQAQKQKQLQGMPQLQRMPGQAQMAANQRHGMQAGMNFMGRNTQQQQQLIAQQGKASISFLSWWYGILERTERSLWYT